VAKDRWAYHIVVSQVWVGFCLVVFGADLGEENFVFDAIVGAMRMKLVV
jgi:hypothetical protein